MQVKCEMAAECKASGAHEECEHWNPHEVETMQNGEVCTEEMECLGGTLVRCIPVSQPDWDK